jgi:hypothetical protein
MSMETAAIISEVFATHPDLKEITTATTVGGWGHYTNLHTLAVYHLLDELMPNKQEKERRVAQWMLTISKSEAARRTQEE